MTIEFEVRLQPYHVPYAVIKPSGYGRMDLSTPTRGLATDGLMSCIAIVCHCPQIKRTVLIHSPGYMFMQPTLQPIFDWTLGKGEQLFTEMNTLEMAIVRGYSYRTDFFNKFMIDFHYFVNVTYPAQAVFILITNPLLVSSNGAMLVDKGTAKITSLQLALLQDAYVNLYPPCYTKQQYVREAFKADLFPFIYQNNGTIITSRHLQFDVNHYTPHGSLTDECRLALRAKFSLNQTDLQLLQLLMSFNIFIDVTQFEDCIQFIQITIDAGLPCELCHFSAVVVCVDCAGAWYCSHIHQAEDWLMHERFCRLYSLVNNVSVRRVRT